MEEGGKEVALERAVVEEDVEPIPGVAAGAQAERAGRSPCPQHPGGTRPTARQRQQRARVKPEPFNCVLTGTGGGRGQDSRAAAVLEPEEGKDRKGGGGVQALSTAVGGQLCSGVAPVQCLLGNC